MVMQVVLKRQVCIFIEKYSPIIVLAPVFEAAVACRY
jgi:hypothetical protein